MGTAGGSNIHQASVKLSSVSQAGALGPVPAASGRTCGLHGWLADELYHDPLALTSLSLNMASLRRSKG